MSHPSQPPKFLTLLAIQGISNTPQLILTRPHTASEVRSAVNKVLNHWHDECLANAKGKEIISLAELQGSGKVSAEEITALRPRTGEERWQRGWSIREKKQKQKSKKAEDVVVGDVKVGDGDIVEFVDSAE